MSHILPCYNMDTTLAGETGDFILRCAANGFVTERASMVPELLASVQKFGCSPYPECFFL